MIWNKIKNHFSLVIISIIAIVIIIAIYSDIFYMYKINSKENIFYLLLSKWVLIILILVFNYYKIFYKKNLKQNKSPKNNKTNSQPDEIVLKKDKLLSKTDLILKKYKKECNYV